MLCILLAACSDSLFDGDGGKRSSRCCGLDYNGGTPGTLKPRGNRCDNVRHTFDEANNQWEPAYDIY